MTDRMNTGPERDDDRNGDAEHLRLSPADTDMFDTSDAPVDGGSVPEGRITVDPLFVAAHPEVVEYLHGLSGDLGLEVDDLRGDPSIGVLQFSDETAEHVEQESAPENTGAASGITGTLAARFRLAAENLYGDDGEENEDDPDIGDVFVADMNPDAEYDEQFGPDDTDYRIPTVVAGVSAADAESGALHMLQPTEEGDLTPDQEALAGVWFPLLSPKERNTFIARGFQALPQQGTAEYEAVYRDAQKLLGLDNPFECVGHPALSDASDSQDSRNDDDDDGGDFSILKSVFS